MRIIQLALFFLIVTGMTLYVNTLGLISDCKDKGCVQENPNTPTSVVIDEIDSIMNKMLSNIAFAALSTVIFGMLIYALKPMNWIMGLAVGYCGFFINYTLADLPALFKSVVILVVMIVYVIDYMSFSSKAPTETGG